MAGKWIDLFIIIAFAIAIWRDFAAGLFVRYSAYLEYCSLLPSDSTAMRNCHYT